MTLRPHTILILIISLLCGCSKTQKPAEHKFVPSDWFYSQRAYPYNQIDHNAYQNSIRYIKQNTHLRSSQEGYNDPWQPVGPRNINGRVTDIEMPADNQNIIYTGTASGGIFKSMNQGESWDPIFDDALSLSIGDMALAPSDNEIIYVGTGEANGGGGSIAYDGVGVYRSDDAGRSWKHIGLDDVGSIGKVVINPIDPDEVYVAAMGRLFGNNKERGVYKTTDGGKTWTQILFVSDKTGAIDLAINPVNPEIIYAAMWQRERRPSNRTYGGATSGIYRSEDAGATWTELTEGLPNDPAEKGRIGIAIAPTNPDVLYSMYAKTNGSLQGMYKTENGGDQWFAIDDRAISDVPFIWWFGKVTVDPTDENIAYATSLDMFTTRNGGDSWFFVFAGAHVDHHALFVHPQDPDLLINGNDGGVYISTNGGARHSYKNTIPNLQFYTCFIDNTNPERIFGGTQDNGTLMITEANEWEMIFGGDGFRVITDPNDPNIVFAESQYGNLRRSTDGGNTFSNGRSGTSGLTNWNTPYIMDPNNSSIMYYGSDKIFKSVDQGKSWVAITGRIPNATTEGNIPYGTLTTLSVSPLNDNYLYAGTDDGQVVFLDQTNNALTNISTGLPNRWVTSIAADPHDASSVYVTLSGFRFDEVGAHVYKSSNRGEDWEDISISLPDVPVNDIIIDPIESGTLYIATDIGVFYSLDDGDSWELLGEDLPLVPVNDIHLHAPSKKLAAATYGRSIFTYDLPFSTSTQDGKAEETFSLYPNPSTNYIKLSALEEKQRVDIYNLNGQKIATQIVAENDRIDITELSTGIYFLKAKNRTIRFIKL